MAARRSSRSTVPIPIGSRISNMARLTALSLTLLAAPRHTWHRGSTHIVDLRTLGPGKGLETAIRALLAIAAQYPDILYRIVGATHPNLVAAEGEAYRQSLEDLAAALGVADNIAWDNRFLDTADLLEQIELCDIYLAPYPNLQQVTLGYARLCGRRSAAPVIIHALHPCVRVAGRRCRYPLAAGRQRRDCRSGFAAARGSRRTPRRPEARSWRAAAGPVGASSRARSARCSTRSSSLQPKTS